MSISALKDMAHLPGIPMPVAAANGANGSMWDKAKEKGSQIYDVVANAVTHPKIVAAAKTAAVATISAPAAVVTGLSELSVSGKEKQMQASIAQIEDQVSILKNHRLITQATRLGSCKARFNFFKRPPNNLNIHNLELLIEKIDQLTTSKNHSDRKEEPAEKGLQELDIETHLAQLDREISTMEVFVMAEMKNELQQMQQREQNLAAQVTALQNQQQAKADAARLKTLEDQVNGNCCIKHCVIL